MIETVIVMIGVTITVGLHVIAAFAMMTPAAEETTTDMIEGVVDLAVVMTNLVMLVIIIALVAATVVAVDVAAAVVSVIKGVEAVAEAKEKTAVQRHPLPAALLLAAVVRKSRRFSS